MITFNPELHRYTNEFDVPIWGVTSLINLVSESSIADAPAHIMQSAVDRGNALHYAIESLLSGGNLADVDVPEQDYDDIVKALSWVNGKFQHDKLESMVYCDYLCGHVDFIGKYNGKFTIADWKSTRNVKNVYANGKDFIKWGIQLNLYALLLESMGELPYEYDLKVFHFPSNKSQVYIYDLNNVSFKLLAKMMLDFVSTWSTSPDKKLTPRGKQELLSLRKYYNLVKLNVEVDYDVEDFVDDFSNDGELQIYDTQLVKKYTDIFTKYNELKSEIKVLESQEKHFKFELYKAMCEYGVKSFNANGVQYTVTDPTTRNVLDNERVSELLSPEELLSCYKTTNVKGSLKVTPSKDKGNGIIKKF